MRSIFLTFLIKYTYINIKIQTPKVKMAFELVQKAILLWASNNTEKCPPDVFPS